MVINGDNNSKTLINDYSSHRTCSICFLVMISQIVCTVINNIISNYPNNSCELLVGNY
jgi:hypothetical protein